MAKTFYPVIVEDIEDTEAAPTNDLVPVEEIELSDAAKEYAAASRNKGTLKSYASDWRHFESWCNERRWPALPSTVIVVSNYASWMGKNGFAANTISKRIVVVGLAHQAARQWNPCGDASVRALLAGIKKTLGGPNKKQALLKADLKQMVDILDRTTVEGRRDFALLILGNAGAFRRSELVSLQLSDIIPQDGGLSITVQAARSKSGSAQIKPIVATHSDYCPVRAVQAVQADLRDAGNTTGYLFPSARKKTQALSDRYYAELLKTLAIKIGLDGRNISGHSTRRGRITQMSLDGRGLLEIKRISSHKSIQVLTGYIEQTGSLVNAPKAEL